MDEKKNQVTIQLGFWSVVLFGINGIVGSGIFLLPNTLMKSFGPASSLIFLVDGFLALIIGFAFAECAGLFKEMGGAYIYAKKAFGDFVGYEVGFVQWIVQIITQGAMYVGFATAIMGFFPQIDKNIIVTALAIFLLVINLSGNFMTALVNNVITIAKLIPIFLIIAVGIFTVNLNNFQPFFIPELTTSSNFSKTALLLFFAFGGFEAVAVVTGEIKNPTKNLPKALIIIIGSVVVAYFLIQVACISILGPDLANTTVPIQDGVAKVLGNAGSSIVAAGTIVSMGGICLATSYSMPRAGVAMAEQKMMPSILAQKTKRGVPLTAIFVSTILSLLVSYSGSFEMLANMSSVATFGEYIPTCIAVLVFRKKFRDVPRRFKVPLGWFLPILAVLMSVWLLANSDVISLVGGLGAFIVAIPFYFLTYRLKATNEN